MLVMEIVMTFAHSVRTPTAYLQHVIDFFYKSVAFFFERRLELAHQAPYPALENKTGITCRNVNDALGVQKQKLFARVAN